MHRIVLLLLLAGVTPLQAQSRTNVDALVAQITRGWGVAPHGGWCAEWSVLRGDSSALGTGETTITGDQRTGVYTVAVRPARFAPPVLIGRLRIGHERETVVSAHTIIRGTTLGENDVLVRHAIAWGAPGSAGAIDARALIGTETRRMLREGEPIRASDIAFAPVVHAGDSVTAEVVRDGVRLALVGTALQSAPLGARVAIRFDRGRRLAGIATGRNMVRLD
jgi:flagella basal body P-ring formation protein FlgA